MEWGFDSYSSLGRWYNARSPRWRIAPFGAWIHMIWLNKGDMGGSVMLVVGECSCVLTSVNEPPVPYTVCSCLGDLSARFGLRRAVCVLDQRLQTSWVWAKSFWKTKQLSHGVHAPVQQNAVGVENYHRSLQCLVNGL